MTAKETLRRIFDRASISEGTQLLWLSSVVCVIPSRLPLLIQALEASSPEEIRAFSSLLVQKREAIEKRDMNLWNNVLSAERSYLSQI